MQHMTSILQNPVIPHFAGEREDSHGELSRFCPPKAATGKIDVLTAFYLQDAVHLVLDEGTCFTFQQNAGFKTL